MAETSPKLRQRYREWSEAVRRGRKPPFPDELRGLTCGARTRAGTPCRQTDLGRSGRCKFHGGASTGPRTKAGKAAALANLANCPKPMDGQEMSGPQAPAVVDNGPGSEPYEGATFGNSGGAIAAARAARCSRRREVSEAAIGAREADQAKQSPISRELRREEAAAPAGAEFSDTIKKGKAGELLEAVTREAQQPPAASLEEHPADDRRAARVLAQARQRRREQAARPNPMGR